MRKTSKTYSEPVGLEIWQWFSSGTAIMLDACLWKFLFATIIL